MSTVECHASVALYYATRDGQSRRIAEYIASRLAEAGTAAAAQDSALAQIAPMDMAKDLATDLATELAGASVVVLVAAVRYGRHLPEADRLLAVYQSLDTPPPLALASVNLTARKPLKTTVAGNAYLRKLIARHCLAPAVATAFAGRLDYRRYRFTDRQIIRFIMLLTRGPTDPNTCIEYTSWQAVDEFVARIIELARRPQSVSDDQARRENNVS